VRVGLGLHAGKGALKSVPFVLKPMNLTSRIAGLTGLAMTLASATSLGADRTITAPLVCSRGGNGKAFRAIVSLPDSQPTGSRYAVRIDSFPSGKVAHFGLNYIFDMMTSYRVPAGTKYVEGSARVVPNTGTANVRAGARAWHDANGVHLLLPARVENGGSYTPPSLQFQLEVTAAAGTELLLKLGGCKVSANVLLLGNVDTTCVPAPAPFTIGKTVALPRPAADAK